MAYNRNDFFNKVRHFDNRASQWMGRHFYIILFEFFLAIIFLFAFINALKILNISFSVSKDDIVNQLLLSETVNSMLIVMLLVLVALGVLNVINGNARLRSILKNIEFSVTPRRSGDKSPNQPPKD